MIEFVAGFGLGLAAAAAFILVLFIKFLRNF